MTETYIANIRIRDLPRDVDNLMTALAEKRNIAKWKLTRIALCEFVENHKKELDATR